MPGAQGGARIRNARPEGSEGTLACVVQSRSGPRQRYILSAAHILALNGLARPGDAIEYQTKAGGAWRKIAEYERFVPFRAAGTLQQCDAAIARITNDALVDDAIGGIGQPRGVSELLYRDLKLALNGATSGLVSDAMLHSTGTVVPITYDDVQGDGQYTLKFEEQILYGRKSGVVWSPATSHGDSGALVLNQDGYAIGLHIASTPANYPKQVSVCTPISLVLDALEVDLAEPAAGAAPAAFPSADEVGQQSFDTLGASIRSLLEPHNPFGGVTWQLSRDGLIVEGKLERTGGKLVTVPRVWQNFGASIRAHAAHCNVPAELIVATICTESGGNPQAVRIEPGWHDDESTPGRVSPGLMQTLISTARDTLGDQSIDRARLLDPDLSIRAGTAYIDRQRGRTLLDPPRVACAYNAGSLQPNDGAANRWKMKQFPIGTGEHADRFVKWFNDCTAFFLEQPDKVPADAPSFYKLLRGG